MEPYLSERFGNASSIHAFGRDAKAALEAARRQVADLIGSLAEEIVFTSGGTESDNFALVGAALRGRERGNHIISTQIEHHAVLHTLDFLKSLRFEVDLLPPDSDGIVQPNAVAQALRGDTILVSVMAANNEIGSIQPVREIGRIVRERGIPFHTDAVQAVGTIPVSVEEWNVDLLSLSGHKLYGPKGIGALYIRAGTPMTAFIHGGDQERRRRGGTENVLGAVGLGVACELAGKEREETTERLCRLRDIMIQRLCADMEGVRLNGHRTCRLPNNVNVSFAGVSGESLVQSLDLQGVAASGGSACSSGSPEPSHVLQALGLPAPLVESAVRYSLGRETSLEEVETVLRLTQEIVRHVRAIKSNAVQERCIT